MRRVWIPALAVTIVVAAGLIAIAYDQRGAQPAVAAEVGQGPRAERNDARQPRVSETAAEPAETDAFGGSWNGGAGASREAFDQTDAFSQDASAAPIDATDDAADDAADEPASEATYSATAREAYPASRDAFEEPAPAIESEPSIAEQAKQSPLATSPRRPKPLAGPAAQQAGGRQQGSRKPVVPASAEQFEEEPAAGEPEDAGAPADAYAPPAQQTAAPAGDAFGGYESSVPATAAPAEIQEHAPTHRPLASAMPASPSFDEGTGEPGAREMEGLQAPSISIEKIAPPEVQVGKETEFSIRVRNNGVVAVHNLELRDEVPKGARLVNTSPSASRGPRGELLWQFDTLAPNEEKIVKISLLALAEGELGSVATVVFEGRASSRSKATQPALVVEVDGPSEVMIGEQVTLTMKITNTGTGAATNVVLGESIPEQFTHPAGKELELALGTLKPGQTQTVELQLAASKAGIAKNLIELEADGGLKVNKEMDLQVLAPDLKLAVDGPKKRFLETKATYTVSVSNPGTASAKNVEVVTYLPKGLKFLQANNSGQYDAVKHAVQWNLVELPASETGDVTLVAEPVEQGEHKLRVEGRAQQGLTDQVEETVLVEGLAAIMFQVADLEDPIEVGGETTYEIRVINQGSKAATQVQLVAMLDGGMTLVNASGPARHGAKGQNVEFEPLKALAPKAEATYKVRVRAAVPGDLRLRVQVVTAEMKQPVTKEESTTAYGGE